ncbi:DUF1484 family protein [Acinetobacter pittii]|uniref:DUF1484 family protein n=1 Tax=Acinetobacter pittii TaxID=48296 RepID=UPI002043D448|nr:DUF1484 family protein [Acinetobacter pittii]MCM5532759.1 DUF1484 domain-containing protein [Acinetobacter pittii]
MPNITARSEQSTVTPTAPALAISRQSPLIAELIELAVPADTPDKLRVQELAYQLDALQDSIHSAAADGCDNLLRVSAGLGAVLQLLDGDNAASLAAHDIHCLLAPLKRQLDGAVSRVQGMI